MIKKQRAVSMGGMTTTLLVCINVIILKAAFLHDDRLYWILVMTLPLLLLSILQKRYRYYQHQQDKHTRPFSRISLGEEKINKS